MCPKTEHRSHKGLNNRAENAHQPTRRKEKTLTKFKFPQEVQSTLSLMGKVKNIFAY
jgi:putative transposase